MTDPEYGNDVPSDGARQPRGDAGKRHSRPPPGVRDANAQPHANGRPDDKTGEKPGKSRKRRKRKRGRKVFARDDAPQNKPAPPESIQPQPKPPAPPPVPAAGRFNGRDVASGGDAPVYAALDLGTNNCRLLVAIPGKGGQFRVVDAFSRIVRLGEGLTASGRLSNAAMDRAVEALKVCAEKLRSRRLKRVRLIATEACRSAANGAEFIARVRRETGLSLEIIDRKTEARLAVSGCGSLVERGTKGVVLFDIGGGSSEIALVDVSRHRTPRLANHIVSWTSLPVGVVSLAERFGGRHVTREVFDAMVDDVADMLDRFEGRDRLSHVLADDGFHLLGTSGTVTTLAGIHLGLERYDRRRVDGLWLQNDEVDAMIATLLDWEFEKRVANPCIGADRADLVLGGCAILEAIRRVWPSKRLRVADRGLREGMLSELMADDGVWRRARKRRPLNA
ncbi:Ppx/GppA phosphatase family protein [Aliihoeflea sp. 2WW]|uniref:Ppx/GppA phosphatase family protein n=1 Tax=Aliihoeflea sp. 2WW TaxID=1381123 RepID=UPI000466A4B8|nr:Ppx/GppA phosphatase family protein [Aliihoeflea sp. 2WW]